MLRMYTIVRAASAGGNPCPAPHFSAEIETCIAAPCSIVASNLIAAGIEGDSSFLFPVQPATMSTMQAASYGAIGAVLLMTLLVTGAVLAFKYTAAGSSFFKARAASWATPPASPIRPSRRRSNSNSKLLSNMRRRRPSLGADATDSNFGMGLIVDSEMGALRDMIAEASPKHDGFDTIVLPHSSLTIHDHMEVVATGGSGRVFKTSLEIDILADAYAPKLDRVDVTHVTTGTEVALKEMLPAPGRRPIDDFTKELGFLLKLHHENIVPFYGIYIQDLESKETDLCTPRHRYFLVSKFACGGHLGAQITRPFRDVGFATRLQWFREVARAVGYIHSKQVVHRDIKPDNIVIDEQGHCQLTDFGIARTLTSDTCVPVEEGTISFMPPEGIRKMRTVTTAAAATRADRCVAYSALAWDNYSLGVLAATIFNGFYPYEGLKLPQIREGVLVRGLRPRRPRRLCTIGRRFITRMWSSAPEQRPTVADVLQALDSGVFQEADLEARTNPKIRRCMPLPGSSGSSGVRRMASEQLGNPKTSGSTVADTCCDVAEDSVTRFAIRSLMKTWPDRSMRAEVSCSIVEPIDIEFPAAQKRRKSTGRAERPGTEQPTITQTLRQT